MHADRTRVRAGCCADAREKVLEDREFRDPRALARDLERVSVEVLDEAARMRSERKRLQAEANALLEQELEAQQVHLQLMAWRWELATAEVC
jgi:hypothetical protein